MFERRILRGLMLAMALALIVALLPSLALAERHGAQGGPEPQAVGHVTISGDPLTIHVAVDTSIQVFYAGQSAGQVYPSAFNEADSGGFAWLEIPDTGFRGYGPNFANHDQTSANLLNPWLPSGPQVTMGTGTAADPWWVQTTVAGWAYTVTQWVRYVNGDDCFTVSYIINDGEMGQGWDAPITFFHAADLYVDGDNGGFGYLDTATGAVGAWNEPGDFLEYLVPLTTANQLPMPPASHHQEADYQTIWDAIGTGPASLGPGFDDTVIASPFHNSGCGLQWDLAFPGAPVPNNFVELALDWCFLEMEQPPPPPPEFVPEPGSVMLLASGLMGLAGYAGLRIRKR